MLRQILFQSVATFGTYSKGLTLMLLNIRGVVITDNIRAIIIFETDLNITNKLYFGIRQKYVL